MMNAVQLGLCLVFAAREEKGRGGMPGDEVVGQSVLIVFVNILK